MPPTPGAPASGAAWKNWPTRPEFRDHKENEFPHGANDPDAKLNRRELMKVMAASAAFAGLSGCTKLPTQKIVPYVRQPEEIIPGKPLFYATAVTLGGVATGVLVESHMARPTKVEGNPDHPASLGAADSFAQASVLGLYDPDRSRAEVHDGRLASWAEFQSELSLALGGPPAHVGPAPAHRHDHFALAWRSDSRAPLAISPAPNGCSTNRSRATTSAKALSLAFGEFVNTVYRVDAGRRHSHPRFRFSYRRAQEASATPVSSPASAASKTKIRK